MQHLDRPVVCPVLIGRAPHLEVLERYLKQAVENRGQTLLIAGEAGVGKSRLRGRGAGAGRATRYGGPGGPLLRVAPVPPVRAADRPAPLGGAW